MAERTERSSWTHALCDLCFFSIKGKGAKAVRLKQPQAELCCECNEPTTSGIYYREDPKQMECLGVHSNAQSTNSETTS